MSENKKIRVMELFAGVGGFHKGLKQANEELFDVVWANQWEPSRKTQDAYECYKKNFEKTTVSNQDIGEVTNEEFQTISPNLLVGGFPCQDYSVARTLSGEKGIQGKKGVLFWQIKRVIENTNPKYVLLENVDRLLKSPSSQRGRDFAVMLATFRDLNYNVEWRVINAADYGFAQRRRRVFIFAYRNDQQFAATQRALESKDIIFSEGFFAKAFPVELDEYKKRINPGKLPEDIIEISDSYIFNFHTAGIMRDGEFLTAQVIPVFKEPKTLAEVILDESLVDEKYYLSPESVEKFRILRGAKKINRTTKDGHSYVFSEGSMSEFDELTKPGRTMLTSEGSNNRSTHIIKGKKGLRFLTPIECEKLNGFPANWTNQMTDRMRYFCMGNALVVDLIQIMGEQIEMIEKNIPPNK